MSQAWVERVASDLLEAGARPISLDEIGEAIGLTWAQPGEIDRLFLLLEEAGATIVDPERDELAPSLLLVLRAARQLRAEGRSASPREIAECSGLSERRVRVALLYGEVLSRGQILSTKGRGHEER